MFKSNSYKKLRISRNFSLIMLICLLFLSGGKLIMAHDKIAVYKEALASFMEGDYVAAEEKFRAAKRNFAVTDHNQDIDELLAVLSPIRETMEALDEKADQYQESGNFDELCTAYNDWKGNEEKWVSGTSVQAAMYKEMLAMTKLDKEFDRHFLGMKKTQLLTLRGTSIIGDTGEEEILTILHKIPAAYYGGDAEKANEILTAFQQYYASQIKALIAADASVSGVFAEGTRQFDMLANFSIDDGWLQTTLDSYLLKILRGEIATKDYAAFAEQAKSVNTLSAHLGDAIVIPFINETRSQLLTKAKNLVNIEKYTEAISLYEALQPLEDTGPLIAEVNHAWDRAEPIRVLKRLYPAKEFQVFVDAANKWGADSVIAAITTEGSFYFGILKGNDGMKVTEGSIEGVPAIQKLDFKSGLTASEYPVVYIDAKSTARKHHYLAYEVRKDSMKKILDVEADDLTIEAKQILLADNPVGDGEGESAYFEPDSEGIYRFSKVKVDYTDINVHDIANYLGKMVRFTAFPEVVTDAGALVKLSEILNPSTGRAEKSYLLLKGGFDFTIYANYTVIGVFNGYEEIPFENDETIRVPVVQVKKMESES